MLVLRNGPLFCRPQGFQLSPQLHHDGCLWYKCEMRRPTRRRWLVLSLKGIIPLQTAGTSYPHFSRRCSGAEVTATPFPPQTFRGVTAGVTNRNVNGLFQTEHRFEPPEPPWAAPYPLWYLRKYFSDHRIFSHPSQSWKCLCLFMK